MTLANNFTISQQSIYNEATDSDFRERFTTWPSDHEKLEIMVKTYLNWKLQISLKNFIVIFHTLSKSV